MPLPVLSVIISTSAGRQDHLDHCLQALARQTLQNFEVLVMDDGSEGMATRLKAFEGLWPRLEYHRRAVDYNLSRSRNRGAALAQADTLVFVNGDVLLNPHALENYALTLERLPEALCWGYVGCRKSVSAASLWFEGVEVNWLDFRFFPLSESELYLNPGLKYAPHTLASGHHFALRRSSWQTLGPLDESFQFWGEEDVEYALRGLLAQRPMVFLGDAWAEHQVHAYGEVFHVQAPQALEQKINKIIAMENRLNQAQKSMNDLIYIIFEREQAGFYKSLQSHYLWQNPDAIIREMGKMP